MACSSKSNESQAIITSGAFDIESVEWEETDLNLTNLLSEGMLPCIASFEEIVTTTDPNGESPKVRALPPALKLYSNQPVLFHTKDRKRQARGRSIYKDDGGYYFEVGQTLVIPEDYLGKLSIHDSLYFFKENV